LDEISEYIRATHTHDDAANEQVTKRFFYLKSAATRLGRIDWLSIFVGQMVSMASNGIFNAAALSDVMHFAGTAFHTMIKLLGS
jgi:hypothetical protein